MTKWENEPNGKKWEAHGYRCEIKRVEFSGHLSGYVTIPDSHPWFGLSYGDPVTPIANPDMDHGSILGAFCQALGDERSDGMCSMDTGISVHGGVTYGENPGYGWTIGFDCAHSGDYCPVSEAKYAAMGFKFIGGGTYRDIDYVTRETESLAEQLRKVEMRGTR